jgi:hypothetical protein
MLALPVFAAAQGTIKIGATEPLSGTFKDIGERYLEGVQYAAKVINESGGLLGKKVEVIPIDSELKPDVATRKAQALILKDEVKFFCGGTGLVGRPWPSLRKRRRHRLLADTSADRREVQQELLPTGRKH